MNIIKKPIIKFVLVFLVILLIIVPQQVNAAKLVLNVNPYCQQNSNWCWAAASQSIIEYHRKWETQCQVYKWGKIPLVVQAMNNLVCQDIVHYSKELD